MLPSVDGCTLVASAASGLAVIDQNGLTEHAADGDLVALTPDGHGAVTESTAGRLLLTDVTSTPGTPAGDRPDVSVPGASVPGTSASGASDESGTLDLGPASRLVLFTRR
jgi:hypothetical protein